MAKCHNAIFNEMPHTASQPAGQSVSWSTAAKKKKKLNDRCIIHVCILYIVVPVCTWNMYMYMLHTSCHVHAYYAKLIAACTCVYMHMTC